jgi:hypothetical protein
MLTNMRLAPLAGLMLVLIIITILEITGRPMDATGGEVANLKAQRQAIVVKSMEFKNDQERDVFLKVYEPYQARLMKLAEERAVLIEAYSQSRKLDTLKSETAKNILRRALAQDAGRVRLITDYIGQLEQILPIQKVVRAYQIENRLQAVVAINVAKNIPLAK